MKSAVLIAIAAGSLFGQSYTVSTFAGGGLPVNIPAPSAAIGPISSVAVDTSGNLYFPSGNAVFRMDASTHILTLVAGTGTPGFSGDSGPATAAQLNQPNAIAIDSAGNIYIADGNRIRQVSNGIITTIAGNGTPGATGDNGPAISAAVAPLSLAVDSSGNLYFTGDVKIEVIPEGFGSAAIRSGSIRKISNGIITTIAGNGAFTATADNVPATSVPLYEPNGIAVDAAGNIYVACSSDPNTAGLVRKISNGILTTVAGGAAPTDTSNTALYSGPPLGATLGTLDGLALDSAGDIFFADVENNVVREISHGSLATVAGYGPSGYGGDGGPATGARLNAPQGIAVDFAGNLYVADWDNDVIREVTNGIISTAAGNGLLNFSGDNGPAISAQFDIPAGLALDSAGNLYIADQDNSRIREVSGGTIATVAGSSAWEFSGDGGPATAAGLYVPESVAVDSAGNIYIADTADSCVRKVTGGVITTIAGRGSGINGFGDGGPATAAFFASVVAVAVDSAGDVYVSDQVAARVRKISNGIITTVAGNGNPGFSGDNGPATSAELLDPRDLAIDSQGNLYINDAGNHRIREVSSGVISTVAGTGGVSSSGDGGPATSAGILPAGLAFDSAGNLYVSDTGSIRKISGGIIRTVAGTGTAGFSGGNLPARSAQMTPGALAVDSAGNVYFSEPGANRVRVLRPQAGDCSAVLTQTNVTVGDDGGNLDLAVRHCRSK